MNLSKREIQELKDEKASVEDLNDEYFINSQDNFEFSNTLKLLNENICSFKEIVDKFKSIKDHDNDPSLWKLLENKELFKKLIKNNKLTQDDLKHLLNAIDDYYELDYLSENTTLLKYNVDKGLFKELVDKFKSIKDSDNDPCLFRLMWNKKFFKEVLENNRLTKEDLRYLLNKIDNIHELEKLCRDTSLIKYILNEFVLDKKDIDKFNTLIENAKWCKYYEIHTIFDLIAYYNKNNKEILKLNELNRKIYLLNTFDLNIDERLELVEILRDNEQARNRLIQIIDNHLEDQYDFEKLKSLLTKEDKKSLKTKFNF